MDDEKPKRINKKDIVPELIENQIQQQKHEYD